jgi:hypothetical protein
MDFAIREFSDGQFIKLTDVLLLWHITVSTAVRYDETIKAIRVKVPGTTDEFFLHPATVRRNDRSAKSIVGIPQLHQPSINLLEGVKS